MAEVVAAGAADDCSCGGQPLGPSDSLTPGMVGAPLALAAAASSAGFLGPDLSFGQEVAPVRSGSTGAPFHLGSGSAADHDGEVLMARKITVAEKRSIGESVRVA